MALNAELQNLGWSLHAQRDEIMFQWLKVLDEEQLMVSTRSLDDMGLRDHIAHLLDDLAAQLQVAVNHASEADALRNAETHGGMRWAQKFQLHELLREIAMLRTIIIERVERYASSHPKFNAEARCSGHKIIHRFFDGLIVASAHRFSELKNDAVKKAQQDLQALNDALEQRNKEYAAVDASRARMVRTLAHELRNPLNTLLLAARVLNTKDEEILAEAAGTIQRTVKTYRDLLEQILEFSRAEQAQTVQSASFPLQPLFEELVRLPQAGAKAKGLEFQANLDPTFQEVMSDRTRVLLIAQNLLSNAVKYTDSGSVTFSIRAASEHLWEIEVRDTGHGIPEGEQEEVFKEFHRLSPHGGAPGTGLGLSIVKRAVATLKGSIEVQSEVGKGSRFTVSLPRQKL